ncbi:uncharacterized protein LOC112589235 [Harpegnathos saltator]|uniref:uncharacterized protein LOC112589235 n=1 Tax=Harpegnathos saltator TaxID=610380 RepID=UPI000DBEE0B0|nr:uncharacterized protein LOC112589235 [Harpegnathos saltator]
MCESVPRPPAMHILGRRYALTATAYKYLNIGISVGAEPVIDIVIDDNRGKQLLLPIKTWNALMGQRADIQRFLQANFYKSSSPPMRIEELTITSLMKASVVERFNRTLKNNMWKMLTFNGTYKWIDSLPRLVVEYNTRKHRTIGMRPIDVTPMIANKLLNTVYSNIKIAAPAKFKVGDLVRVNSRGKSIAGGFYEHELHSVINPDVYLVEKVLRRQGDKVYVKWLGFDNSHNSWIQKDNVL